MTEAERLSVGIAELGLDVALEVQQQLLRYLVLLQKWNKVYNLTAVRNPHDMVVLHLLDSLSVLPYVREGRLLDVGSGAGLPGIVLAIVRPSLQVTTIDTVQKKTIFMRQVKGELGLKNLEVVHARVENYKPELAFEQVISRAFSEIGLLVRLTQHLIAPSGRWLAMKGLVPKQEMEAVNIVAESIITLHVPFLGADRHLLVFENHP